TATKEFVEGFRKPQADFTHAGSGRWHLAPSRKLKGGYRLNWLSLLDLFGSAQGVTPGGEGCLDIFMMDETQARALRLENDLIHPVVKGIEIKKWRSAKSRKVILYPYTINDDKARPAFNLDAWKADQTGRIPTALRALKDALDFRVVLDSQEAKYRN